MEEDKYTNKIKSLYCELQEVVTQPLYPIKNYDNDLMHIQCTLHKIIHQLGLFTKTNGITYYNHITLAALEAYKLLQKITPPVEPHIKQELLSKALCIFDIYAHMMDDPKARLRIQTIKGNSNKTLQSKRAIAILLPRIVAKYLTNNSDFMNHHFIHVIHSEVASNETIPITELIIKYLKANPNLITVNKIIKDKKHKEELEKLIYSILEDFFNEIKNVQNNQSTARPEHWLDGNYGYTKFNKHSNFKEYKDKMDPNRNQILKKIKSIIEQIII